MQRPGAVDAEQLVVRRGLVELVLVHHHELGPEGAYGPVRNPDDALPAVERAAHIGEVGHPDQSLGAEQELLPAAAQRHIGLLAERNHDVREAVQEVQLVDEARCPAPHEISVQDERALPLSEHAEVASHVEVSTQPVPRGQVGVGILGLRGAEQEVPEVLPPLPDLPTDAEPHGPVRRQRDELHPVPEVIRLAQINPLQDRPVFVEPCGISDLKGGPLRFARRRTRLGPRGQRAGNEGQGERETEDDGGAEATG